MRTELTAADRDFLRITDNVYDPGDRDQSYAKAMLAVLYGDNEVYSLTGLGPKAVSNTGVELPVEVDHVFPLSRADDPLDLRDRLRESIHGRSPDRGYHDYLNRGLYAGVPASEPRPSINSLLNLRPMLESDNLLKSNCVLSDEEDAAFRVEHVSRILAKREELLMVMVEFGKITSTDLQLLIGNRGPAFAEACQDDFQQCEDLEILAYQTEAVIDAIESGKSPQGRIEFIDAARFTRIKRILTDTFFGDLKERSHCVLIHEKMPRPESLNGIFAGSTGQEVQDEEEIGVMLVNLDNPRTLGALKKLRLELRGSDRVTKFTNPKDAVGAVQKNIVQLIDTIVTTDEQIAEHDCVAESTLGTRAILGRIMQALEQKAEMGSAIGVQDVSRSGLPVHDRSVA